MNFFYSSFVNKILKITGWAPLPRKIAMNNWTLTIATTGKLFFFFIYFPEILQTTKKTNSFHKINFQSLLKLHIRPNILKI